MALQVGELYATCGLDTRDFDNNYSDVMNRIDRFGSSASPAGDRFNVMGNIIQGAFQGIGQAIVGAIGKVVDFGKQAIVSGVQYNAMMEQSEIAWTTILGSAEKAVETIEKLQILGAETPFEFEGLDATAKLLNMAGFEGDELFKTLVNVGDAVSAIGGNDEVLQGIGTALFQMATKGKVSAEEMNQLAERGIPAWGILADKMGVSTSELMEMVSKGKMMADEIIPLLVEGMGDRFGGAMEKQSKTFSGLVSTIQDNFKMMMAEATKGLTQLIKDQLPKIISLIDNITEKLQNGGFDEFQDGLKKVGEKLVDTFGPAITPIIESFLGIIHKIKDFLVELVQDGTFSQFVENITDGAKTISTIFGDVYKTISEFVQNILGKALEIAKPMIEEFVEVVGSIATTLKEFWEEHGETITAIIQGFLDFITPLITFALQFIASTVMGVVNGIKNMIEGALTFISGVFNTFSALFSGDWSALWEGIKEMLSGALQFILGLFEYIFNMKILKALGGFATNAINVIKGWVGNVKNWFTNMGSSISSITSASLEQVRNFFSTKMEWIKNLVSNIINAIKGFFSGGLSAIENNVSQIFTQITNLGTKIKDVFGNLIKDALNWGVDIVKGIANGISGAVGTAIQAVKNVANSIMSTFKGMLGIKSPSRVFKQYGVWTMEGLHNGIEDNLDDTEALAKDMARALNPDFSDIEFPDFPSGKPNGYGGDVTRGIGNADADNSAGSNGVTIHIDKMEVRDDTDVEKVAHELYKLQERKKRGKR